MPSREGASGRRWPALLLPARTARLTEPPRHQGLQLRHVLHGAVAQLLACMVKGDDIGGFGGGQL